MHSQNHFGIHSVGITQATNPGSQSTHPLFPFIQRRQDGVILETGYIIDQYGNATPAQRVTPAVRYTAPHHHSHHSSSSSPSHHHSHHSSPSHHHSHHSSPSHHHSHHSSSSSPPQSYVPHGLRDVMVQVQVPPRQPQRHYRREVHHYCTFCHSFSRFVQDYDICHHVCDRRKSRYNHCAEIVAVCQRCNNFQCISCDFGM